MGKLEDISVRPRLPSHPDLALHSSSSLCEGNVSLCLWYSLVCCSSESSIDFNRRGKKEEDTGEGGVISAAFTQVRESVVL
jgi:hypothetical protein